MARIKLAPRNLTPQSPGSRITWSLSDPWLYPFCFLICKTWSGLSQQHPTILVPKCLRVSIAAAKHHVPISHHREQLTACTLNCHPCVPSGDFSSSGPGPGPVDWVASSDAWWAASCGFLFRIRTGYQGVHTQDPNTCRTEAGRL